MSARDLLADDMLWICWTVRRKSMRCGLRCDTMTSGGLGRRLDDSQLMSCVEVLCARWWLLGVAERPDYIPSR
jgi:hypothetical protein